MRAQAKSVVLHGKAGQSLKNRANYNHNRRPETGHWHESQAVAA
jgi:hypothetical protein